MNRKKSLLNALPLGKKLTIAIDVDGTVADCSKVDFNKVGKNPCELMKAKPIKGALDAVKKLYRQGHKVVFHSSRNHGSKEVTRKWLKQHGFPFHHVEMEKFVAHIYIDDRAINGCSWKRVMKEIKNPNLPGKLARKRGAV
jgi:predicted secreted acid phosphatase